MIEELFKSREAYGHTVTRQIIEDIAQCSIMRLDPVSMDRLWDLVTMVFKWQLTMNEDVPQLTARHLYEIETFTTRPDTQLQLHRVQNLIDDLTRTLTLTDRAALRDALLSWLRDFNVRISLLLRLGFQNQDGSFATEGFNPMYTRMLDNVGENIYAATKTLNLSRIPRLATAPGYLPNRIEKDRTKLELDLMINQILGEDKRKDSDNKHVFKLTMCEKYEETPDGNKNSENGDNDAAQSHVYSNIHVSNTFDSIKDILDEINVTDDSVNTDLHDQLLNILDEEC